MKAKKTDAVKAFQPSSKLGKSFEELLKNTAQFKQDAIDALDILESLTVNDSETDQKFVADMKAEIEVVQDGLGMLEKKALSYGFSDYKTSLESDHKTLASLAEKMAKVMDAYEFYRDAAAVKKAHLEAQVSSVPLNLDIKSPQLKKIFKPK